MRARSRIAVLAAGTLGLSVALVSTGSLSTANASGPTAQPAGALTLTTFTGSTTGDAWSFGSTTQSVGAVPGTCTLTPTSGALAPLVTLSATGGVPAFATHMIGVNGAPFPNYQCAKINKYAGYAGQSLTIALNNAAVGPLHDAELGAFLAARATLDIEVTDNSKLQADLIAGGAVVGTTQLWADDNKTPTTVPAGYTYCHLPYKTWMRDTYGSKDNCTWAIDKGINFDAIKLTAITGSFSVEGGGDWGAAAASHRTTFDIVKFYDGVTTCGEDITIGGAGDLSGNLVPLDVEGAPCEGGTPYTVDATDDGLTFHKPATADANGQYALQVNRTFPAGTAFPAPGLIVDWEAGEGPLDLALCPAGLIEGVAPTGLPTSINTTVLAGLPDQSPVSPTTKQFACIYNPSTSYDTATGVLSTSDWVWFTGDILVGTKR